MALPSNMKKARLRLLLSDPFFGQLLMQTPLEPRTDIWLGATDMFKIYYHPENVLDLTWQECLFLLLHEIGHIVGEHGWRRGDRDHSKFNEAGDYYINELLKACGHKLIANILLNSKYRGWAVEAIYADLPEPPKPPSGGGGGGEPDPDGDQSDGSGGDDQSDGPQSAAEANAGRNPGGHDRFGNDVLEPPVPANSAEAQERRAEVRAQAAQAAQMARMAGTMSVALDRFVNELLTPQVPWADVLAEYMTEVIKAGEDWGRPNRRFSDVFLPSPRMEHVMGRVAIIGDSSGSITDEMFQRIGSEAAGIAELLQPEAIHMIWATTRVVSDEVFERGEEVILKSPETGGTDMRVPLKHVEDYDPVVVVLITDGHTPWPDVEPPYPLVVCCTTDTDVPVGRVVRVAA